MRSWRVLRRLLALLCCLAACGVAAAPARAQPESPREPQSERVAAYRVVVEAPKELREMLREGLKLVRWQDDPQMTLELLQRLAEESVKEAAEAVATRGYFAAKVGYEIDRSKEPWTVVVRVEPGERTRVTLVDLGFTGPAASDRKAQDVFRRIRREWPLRKGEVFTQQAWEEAKRDAVRKLSALRYAAARVASSEAKVDPEKRSAELRLQLDSGPAFRFGPLEVSGTRRYPETVVANLSPVKPGDEYDRDLLVLYSRRLLETGYFAGARVDVTPDPRQADSAPVRAAVIEGSSQRIETGLSYNTDTAIRFETRYRDVDVLDSAYRLKSELRLDSKIQQARVDLDSPPSSGARWRNYFASVSESTIQEETNTGLAFGVSQNYATSAAPSALIASVHIEEQRVSGQLADHRHALYLGFRRTYRRTDDLVSPRLGYLATVTAGGAAPGLATREFLRGTASLSLFFPLGRQDDLSLRGEAGSVFSNSRSGIPSAFLFRTGGDQTIRGYAFESIGVRQGDAVLGGRYLAWGSVELTHWVSEAWGIAGFTDAGDAWDGERFNPAVGVGGGARFRTPIGPVRIDLAYGEQTRSYRVHFSVGLIF
jgi:translocation and assembly module TamA